MMTSTDLKEHLAGLRMAPAEAAQLLGVSDRTLRRWIEGEEIPGPAEAALRAWRSLDARDLPWKPDAVSIFEDDQDQIARHRRHTEELAALIQRVERRGGACNPWTVDLASRSAKFGPFEVGFYQLQSGGFSLSNYRRKDISPNRERDMPDIEDAAYCIAGALSRARTSYKALAAIADYVRTHSSLSVRRGARLPTAAEAERRRREIEEQAAKLDELAQEALGGTASYRQFERILGALHDLGFFPEIGLVSGVARSFVSADDAPETRAGGRRKKQGA